MEPVFLAAWVTLPAMNRFLDIAMRHKLLSLLSFCFCHVLPNLILAHTDIESEISKKVSVSLLLATNN